TRPAVDYASAFSAQATVTYSAVSVGASPSDAVLTATTTVSPGSNGVGPPPDPKQQGPRYVVDHILELQFVVGAFQINDRPSSIPQQNWDLASKACFTSAKNYAPKTAVASAYGSTFNLQGIPYSFNGFKQQVFTGRIKSQDNVPSDRTYPSDFGPALQKFMKDNEQGAYGAMDDVGKALADPNVGNFPGLKDYFTSYAQGEWKSAIDFLSTWTGRPYESATTTASEPSASRLGGPTTTTPPSIGPLTDCSLVKTTDKGTIAPGPQTYCQCGKVIAGINYKTVGSLVYDVCAGNPHPTVATSTIKKPAAPKTTSANSGTCASGTFSESTCNDECGPGTCKSGSTALGQLYYFCDCP
ncbi:MAG: hypothetical protein Q9225_007756, partial [Loekoesia sp. 1 TL-2023]